MIKVATKFFKKLKDTLPSMATMGIDFVAYFPASESDGLEAKKAYLRHYVSERGNVIAEFEDSVDRVQGERPGLQMAKNLCTSQGATLIIVKLDRAGRGSVLLFAPPTEASAQARRVRGTSRSFGVPQLSAVS